MDKQITLHEYQKAMDIVVRYNKQVGTYDVNTPIKSVCSGRLYNILMINYFNKEWDRIVTIGDVLDNIDIDEFTKIRTCGVNTRDELLSIFSKVNPKK